MIYRVTYPNGMGWIDLDARWKAENMARRHDGSIITEREGRLHVTPEPDRELERDRLNDETWDRYIDDYHRDCYNDDITLPRNY